MLKISYAGCPGLSSHFGAIHSQNVRRKWKLAKNIQTLYFRVQGHLRLSMLTPLKARY